MGQIYFVHKRKGISNMIKIIISFLVGIFIGVILAIIIADRSLARKAKLAEKRSSMMLENGFSMELSPCPHCGSNSIHLNKYDVGGKIHYSLKCDLCGSQTAYFESAVKLAQIWNSRYIPN